MGPLLKATGSKSVFDVSSPKVRFYLRYSKLHKEKQAFYGLRQEDVEALASKDSLVCFLWEGQTDPLLVPYAELRELLRLSKPASDGQYKICVHLRNEAPELYVSGVGRFNFSRFMGWNALEAKIFTEATDVGNLSHSLIQSKLAEIGISQGHSIWIPHHDRTAVFERSIAAREHVLPLPTPFGRIEAIVEEIDVIWLTKGGVRPVAFFEVEHTTSIYSGLLRFNDVFLTFPRDGYQFHIVAEEARRLHYARAIGRATFRASGLGNFCSFLEYSNLIAWHSRTTSAL